MTAFDFFAYEDYLEYEQDSNYADGALIYLPAFRLPNYPVPSGLPGVNGYGGYNRGAAYYNNAIDGNVAETSAAAVALFPTRVEPYGYQGAQYYRSQYI